MRVAKPIEEAKINGKSVASSEAMCVPEKETSQWAKKCIVCGLKEDISAKEVVEFIQSRGYLKTRVNQLADDLWVLDLESKDEGDIILNEDSDWLKLCFSFIRPWEEEDINGRRRVWVHVYGVPLHAWCPQFFKRVGNRFGKVMDIDKNTLDRSDLHKGRILIETPIRGRLCQSFNFRIWNKSFCI